MIRAQRRLHRLVWIVLGPLLVLAVIGGLALRLAPLIQPPTPVSGN